MTPLRLFVATTNRGKLREFEWAASSDFVITPIEATDPPEENGSTFEENAAIKARAYSRRVDGLLFAEDSGLEVMALGGAPGIHSARWAGDDEANNRRLVTSLDGVTDRHARYVCVVALAAHGEILGIWRGEVEGEIVSEARGSGGFGYDPHFFYPPYGRTFAECAAEEKLRVSHRSKALAAMFGSLRNGLHAIG